MAHWDIKRQYKARAEQKVGATFVDFWNGVCDWLSKKNHANCATKLAHIVESHLTEPEAFRLLSVAIAYWVEAAIAHDHQEDEGRSWAALLQCNYYLGLACGAEFATDRASRGGLTQGQAFQQLRRHVPHWLSKFPDGSFRSVAEAIEAILPKAAAFKPRKIAENGKSAHGRSTNATALLGHWSRIDPKIRSALERVVEGGIRRGRKKNPRIDRSADKGSD